MLRRCASTPIRTPRSTTCARCRPHRRAAWLSPRRPLVPQTIGDLAWWFASAGPDVDWSERIRIWTDGAPDRRVGLVQAAGRPRLVRRRGVRTRPTSGGSGSRSSPGRGERRQPASRRRTVRRHRAARGLGRRRLARDGRSCAGLGFAPTGTELTQYFQSLDRELPEPVVPDGLPRPDRRRRRTRSRPASRSIGRPSRRRGCRSRSTRSSSGSSRMRSTWTRSSRRPDGSFAAFTMCWLDRGGAARLLRAGRDAPRPPAPRPRQGGQHPRPAAAPGGRRPRRDGLLRPGRTPRPRRCTSPSASERSRVHRRLRSAVSERRPTIGRMTDPTADAAARPASSATRWARWRSRPTRSTAPRPGAPS